MVAEVPTPEFDNYLREFENQQYGSHYQEQFTQKASFPAGNYGKFDRPRSDRLQFGLDNGMPPLTSTPLRCTIVGALSYGETLSWLINYMVSIFKLCHSSNQNLAKTLTN